MKLIFVHKGEGNVEYKTRYSAGADLIAQENVYISRFDTKVIPTGVSVVDFEFDHDENTIPEIQIRPRSGLSKSGVIVHFGTVDCDYRGEIGVSITNLSSDLLVVKKGNRIAQLVCAAVFRSDSFTIINTKREGGFGSTGV